MKLVILHGSNDRYGASRVLLEDVRAFIALGYVVDVVLPAAGPLTKDLKATGASVTIDDSMIVARRSQPSSLVHAPRLPPASRGADIVILWTIALGAYGALLRARKQPYVLSVHERLAGFAGRALLRMSASAGTPTQVNSIWVQNWVSRVVNTARLRLAYPTSSFARAGESNQAPGRGDLHVVLAGRVNGFKGHLLAIEATTLARRLGLNVTLTLAGAPYPGQESHLADVKRHAELSTAVRYVGEVPSLGQLVEVTRPDLLLMLPTRPEPFGLTPVEAWHLGLPCMGVPSGGARESLAMTGGLTTTTNARDIASDLALLLTHDSWRKVPSDVPVMDLCSQSRRNASWTQLIDMVTAQ